MQVLLFLTALLSALSGVIAGPRADDSRLARAEERLVAAVQAVAPAASVALRPAQPLPAPVRSLGQRRVSPQPARPAPLATVKLIE